MIKTRPIIAFILTLCMLLASMAAPARALTIAEEKKLAEEFLKTVRAHYTIVDDAVIADYVNKLGQDIVSRLPPQPFEYNFYVIEQNTINAFAGPAGHIFIFSGLFEAMESESELAGIMAHEIAHVSARHIADIIEKSKKSQMASMAGMIAGILVGLGGASALGSALSIGSLAAGQSMILAYTRENEMEADFLGRKYLDAAGYNLHGLRRALEKIRAREWYGEEQVPTYLKTHPATRDRLANLENILNRQPAGKPENTFAFERARAALMALYGNPAKSAEHFEQRLTKNGENDAALYGLALALAESGRPEKALEKIRAAVSLRPNDLYLRVAMGRICFMAGKYEEAENQLSIIENISDYGADGLFYLGRTRMAMGNCEGAISAFKKLHEKFPDHKRALYFLGQCMGEQNRLDEAHYYLGMHYSINEEFENARFHFTRALEKTDDADLGKKIRKEIDNLKERK